MPVAPADQPGIFYVASFFFVGNVQPPRHPSSSSENTDNSQLSKWTNLGAHRFGKWPLCWTTYWLKKEWFHGPLFLFPWRTSQLGGMSQMCQKIQESLKSWCILQMLRESLHNQRVNSWNLKKKNIYTYWNCNRWGWLCHIFFVETKGLLKLSPFRIFVFDDLYGKTNEAEISSKLTLESIYSDPCHPAAGFLRASYI